MLEVPWLIVFRCLDLESPSNGFFERNGDKAIVGCRESHGPLAKYLKLRFDYAPGILGTFSPSRRVSDPDMYNGTGVTHVQICMPGLLTSGFLWSWFWGNVPGIPGVVLHNLYPTSIDVKILIKLWNLQSLLIITFHPWIIAKWLYVLPIWQHTTGTCYNQDNGHYHKFQRISVKNLSNGYVSFGGFFIVFSWYLQWKYLNCCCK